MADYLARLMTMEQGKPLQEARAEVAYGPTSLSLSLPPPPPSTISLSLSLCRVPVCVGGGCAASGFLDWFAGEAVRHYGQVHPVHHTDQRMLTQHRPVGLVRWHRCRPGLNARA
jgi:hypothetical protein